MSSWKSPFAIKQIADQGRGALPSERKQMWKAFMVDLEEECDDAPEPAADAGGSATAPPPHDRPATAGSGGAVPDPPRDDAAAAARSSFRWRGPASMHSLYLQQLQRSARMGGNEAREDSRDDSTAAPPAALPSSLPLREWIEHHAENANRAACGPVDKRYLEEATRVALSLAKNLEASYGSGSNANLGLRREAILVENIVVTNTRTGEVEFVNASSAPHDDLQPMPSQRSAISALGRIYYELFTRGLSPPSKSKDQETAAASFSEPSSFDLALNIAEKDSQRDLGDSNRRKQCRRVSEEDSNSHYATLQLAGLPPSLCRLVADMLENDGDDGAGGLFRSDRAMASLSDAACDLRQMVDDPRSFLHDTLLFRLEPVMPDRLYGRNDDLRRCLEVADAFHRREGDAGTERPRSAIMVSGFSGCGKSSLVKEVESLLEKKGWRCLYCKFNQEVRPQPLSTITSAFDRFLVDLVGRLDSDAQQEVKASIANAFQDADIDIEAHHAFFQLIPTLQQLVTVKDICPEPSEMSFNTRDADAAKCRLHQLFVLLTRALSNQNNPLLLCMDDLQWADTASLELINVLMEGIEEVNEDGEEEGGLRNMLLFGCFRSNEVVDSDPLAMCIQQMKDGRAIELKEIHLEGLASDDVNALVSDSLFYPRRLTRSLSNLIHQKSAGNPLHMREFLISLATENLLRYSLSKHKWQFDEDLIQLKTVSEGVADLLTRRLQRLPEGVLSGLQVMSCFGSEVSLEVMRHVRNVCGNSDVTAGLDRAAEELLIKPKPSGSYSFAHDMIQQAVYRGIDPHERVQMLKEIADTLISSTVETRGDAVLFIIVDLINRVGPQNTRDGEDRVLYGNFNLSAGEKSMKIPDMASAIAYLESGISFLDDGYWTQNYSLSLALFKNASLAHWALGKTNLMTKRIDELLDNARCFEDKLDSMNVMIRAYGHSGNSAEKGLELCFSVLEKLGECFPKYLDNDYVKKELTETNRKLQELLPASLDRLPVMKNKQKLQAMIFLYIAIQLSYQLKSRYFPIVSSRLVRITMEFGLSEYSAVGLGFMALSFASVLQDLSEGYKLGKLARSLNKSAKVIPEAQVDFYVLAMVNVWKEPIQSVLPPLLDSHKMAMRGGDTTIACSLAGSYLYRAFYSGSSLVKLNKEMAVFLRLMSRYKRILIYLSVVPLANAIASLTGTERLVGEGIEGCEEDQTNLTNAFNKKEIYLAELIVIKEMMTNFILRRMDAAERLVLQYAEYFEHHESAQPISMVQRSFYSGLIAFHFLRESQDQYWMDIGHIAIQKFEHWTKECQWNFENNFLLLKAEHHFAIGELEAANNCYHSSIASAKRHHFVHEEAIACELASIFHMKSGRKDLSRELLKQSVACYQSWGALKKANALLSRIE